MTNLNSAKEQEKEQYVIQQGKAYDTSLHNLLNEDKHTVIDIDDYRLTASFEPAEGMYMIQPDEALAWQTPREEDNQHFEVIVQDRIDHRFLPFLDITLKLYDEKNNVVVDKHVPFIWHPFVFHYGIDGNIPGEGIYTPEVYIKVPLFNRHDQVRGKRYTKPVRVKLSSVTLTPGKKPYGPE